MKAVQGTRLTERTVVMAVITGMPVSVPLVAVEVNSSSNSTLETAISVAGGYSG